MILKKDVTETTEKETKLQISGFSCMLLSTLGANLLKTMLASKGAIEARPGKGIGFLEQVIKLSKLAVVYESWRGFFILLNSLSISLKWKSITKINLNSKVCPTK